MSKLYTSSEVASHNSRKSCWIVIKDNVYDVTSYLEEHPGGEDPLLDSAGMDATSAFEEAGHSAYAKKQLNKFKIGSLAPGERCGLRTTVYRCENDEKACDSNIIPSNRRPARRPPPSGSKLKYALLALAIAIIAGVAYKKYSSS